jgi:hypothetical protein
MAKRCPSCGYAPIGPFTDNCPICAEPVRNVRSEGRRSGGGGGEGMNPVLKWVLIGGLVGVVAVAGCCGVAVWRMGGAMQDMQKQVVQAQAQAEADRQARTVVVSAAELLREFKDDEKAADEKYAGKYLELTGVVERTAGARRGNPYIVLHAGDEAARVKIECHFDYLLPADEAKFRRLRPGQTVTIRGEYEGQDGKGGPVLVQECKLADPPPAAGPPARTPEE